MTDATAFQLIGLAAIILGVGFIWFDSHERKKQ